MKRKKLRISKSNVYVFNVFSYHDKKFGNTYKRFGECYIVNNNTRKYLNDFGYMNDDDKKVFYSYSDVYDDVKQYLNNNHDSNIRYMSDYKNIVVCKNPVSKRIINL